MRKRNLFILVGTVALLLGGLVYLFFRKNTYVASFFDCQLVEQIRNSLIGINTNFVKFYLPDFLWALSLCCYLLAIFNPKQLGTVFCILTGFLLGVFWEAGQYAHIIKGTGDITDIIMYLFATLFAAFISIKEKRK